MVRFFYKLNSKVAPVLTQSPFLLLCSSFYFFFKIHPSLSPTTQNITTLVGEASPSLPTYCGEKRFTQLSNFQLAIDVDASSRRLNSTGGKRREKTPFTIFDNPHLHFTLDRCNTHSGSYLPIKKKRKR